MNLDIKAVHFSLHDDGREYIEKKMGRLHGETNIVDLHITLTKEVHEFSAEAMVHFRWGVSSHVKELDSDLNAAIDKLFDALAVKITKEKEKVLDRR